MKRTIIVALGLAVAAPAALAQAPPGVPEPQVRIASGSAEVDGRGRAVVVLRCSGGEAITGFYATVTLRAKVNGAVREIGRHKNGFCSSSGSASKVKVPLTAAARKVLGPGRRLSATARAKLRSGDVAKRRITIYGPFILPSG